MLWTAIVTAPMMAVLMGMCARVGLITGEGLIVGLKRIFPAWSVFALIALLVAANTLNIAADYSGMAAVMQLIAPGPQALWLVVFAAVMVYGEIFFSYRTFAGVVKFLCLSLLAYVATAFIVHPPWLHVLFSAFVPAFRWDATWLMTLLGVLGTTITPYLFIWQASMYVEEDLEDKGSPRPSARRVKADVADVHADVNTGMIYSNAMTLFIIVTTAATLGTHHVAIATAADAAAALEPLAGHYASLLFTLGVVGTGLLAIPVMAGASAYALADFYGSAGSLAKRPRQAPLFYAVIAVGLILGVAMSLVHLDAIKLLYYSAVFNGIAVVPLIYFVIRLACSKKILGAWVASTAARTVAWMAFALMLLSALALPLSWFSAAR
jgi:Mn2+/Fe2+ NRAMP family transporter